MIGFKFTTFIIKLYLTHYLIMLILVKNFLTMRGLGFGVWGLGFGVRSRYFNNYLIPNNSGFF
jgi:hypothetical protein